MLIETLIAIFTRDLNRLRSEITSYQKEENIWKVDGDIANSAGNLFLHLIGNLNTYIGKEIGKTGYIRNRESEFSLKDVPRQELLTKIDDTIEVISKSISNLDESTLTKEYHILVFDEKTSTEYLLVHLATHLTYHLGQINYHRRLIDK
ncbi:DUF1572 family protein [Adhaeribacter aquaticus]|uniref:DUF1572 family protein n=1 Tax=Adhaeribacter aquaticus TaxID=299567 RepID=UPI0004111138|nr:DUF1572 family protein [Adhaeribacter aquaticus]